MRLRIELRILSVFLLGLVVLAALGALATCTRPVKASLLPTQTWEWDAHPQAAWYHVYWSVTPASWCANHVAAYPTSACSNGTCQGDITLPPGLVYVVVTALDSAGKETSTGHGPIVACP